jgi:uncharacterized protein YukE
MFNVNLDPLIQQIKEFNTNQMKTNQLLEEIIKELQSNKKVFDKTDQLQKK